MKQWLSLIAFLFFHGCTSEPAAGQTTIPSFPVSICCNRTTNLVFPYAIRGVDRGSREILAQKAVGAENVLQLKAARANFTATSLSVITADGRLFSFLLSYSDSPKTLNLSFAGDSIGNTLKNRILLSAEKINDYILESDARTVVLRKSFLKKRASAEHIVLTVNGIYIKDNLLWFALELNNRSFMDYHADFLDCTIVDRQKAARTAIQETRLPMVYCPSFPLPVGPRSKKTFAIALAPFSIARDKQLILRISEPGGSRSIKLTIKQKTLLRARPGEEGDR